MMKIEGETKRERWKKIDVKNFRYDFTSIVSRVAERFFCPLFCHFCRCRPSRGRIELGDCWTRPIVAREETWEMISIYVYQLFTIDSLNIFVLSFRFRCFAFAAITFFQLHRSTKFNSISIQIKISWIVVKYSSNFLKFDVSNSLNCVCGCYSLSLYFSNNLFTS